MISALRMSAKNCISYLVSLTWLCCSVTIFVSALILSTAEGDNSLELGDGWIRCNAATSQRELITNISSVLAEVILSN